MFGYSCEECHEGTVRKTLIKGFVIRLGGKPFAVPDAQVGICDKCGGRHFNGRELKRWRKLKEAAEK